MSGTVTGGLKAADTNRERHGADFYHRMGVLGGSKKHPDKGFGTNRELAIEAGRIGGRKSKRPKAVKA